jgi:hypothetical protein
MIGAHPEPLYIACINKEINLLVVMIRRLDPRQLVSFSFRLLPFSPFFKVGNIF